MSANKQSNSQKSPTPEPIKNGPKLFQGALDGFTKEKSTANTNQQKK
ncbi:hypothetical protein OHW12_17595 [Acinetobacter baumannii]|nr:hypothetical protein [Acinetobacter baumannii]